MKKIKQFFIDLYSKYKAEKKLSSDYKSSKPYTPLLTTIKRIICFVVILLYLIFILQPFASHATVTQEDFSDYGWYSYTLIEGSVDWGAFNKDVNYYDSFWVYYVPYSSNDPDSNLLDFYCGEFRIGDIVFTAPNPNPAIDPSLSGGFLVFKADSLNDIYEWTDFALLYHFNVLTFNEDVANNFMLLPFCVSEGSPTEAVIFPGTYLFDESFSIPSWLDNTYLDIYMPGIYALGTSWNNLLFTFDSYGNFNTLKYTLVFDGLYEDDILAHGKNSGWIPGGRIFEVTRPLVSGIVNATQSEYNFILDNVSFYPSGSNDSYELGYQLGYAEGFDAGYQQGLNDSSGNSFLGDFFGGVLDALDSLTLFFGYSLLDILQALLGFFVVLFILKVVAGG